MERLEERLISAEKALKAFKEALDAPLTTLNRDASIQRFEFTLEAVWKLAQRHLREQEGFEIGSPKGVMRACFQSALLTEKEAQIAIDMVDSRNLSVHTYNEALAVAIYQDLPQFFDVLSSLYKAIKSKKA